jgi:hypothetical protein
MTAMEESPELYGAVVAFANSIGLLLAAFHVVLTQTQLVAVGVVLNAAIALLLVIRAQVRLGRKADK